MEEIGVYTIHLDDADLVLLLGALRQCASEADNLGTALWLMRVYDNIKKETANQQPK